MGRPLNPTTIRRLYLNENTRDDLLLTIEEAIENKEIGYNELSIKDLFESLIVDGPELWREMNYTKSGNKSVRELMESGVGQAVNTADFSNITGQIVYNRIKEEYQFPTAIWPELCQTMSTTFLYGERIPGIGGIGASGIEIVGEAEDFPMLGVNEEYIDTAALNKRGFIVAITREMIIMDRTGLLLQRCADGGKYMGINKEFRVISCATGQTGFNNYNRNGVALNTFLTSGAYINHDSTNTLTDWTSVNKADLLFDAMTDPNTGLPIILPAAKMIVPSALKRTANYVIANTQTMTVDNSPVANTLRQTYENPLRKGFYGQPAVTVLTNAYVKAVTGSAAAWYYGDPQSALLYKEAWGQETTEAVDNNEAMFHRDIWQQHKVSECGVPQMMEPRYLTWNGS